MATKRTHRQAHSSAGKASTVNTLRQPVKLVGLTTTRIVQDYLESLATPKALSVWLLFRHGEHEQLLELLSEKFATLSGVRSMLYGIDRFRRDYAALKLLKNSDFLKVAIQRDEVALDKGRRAEAQNRVTNERFRHCRFDSEFHAVLHRAARIVQEILGRCPETATELFDRFGDHPWTKGSASSIVYSERAAAFKYQASSLDVTYGSVNLASCLVNRSPLWSAAALEGIGVKTDGPASVLPSAFTIVGHNTAHCVPKDAQTDRLIRVEPLFNVLLQRIVGAYIRDRLHRFAGINLLDQSANQYLAKLGSLDSSWSTIDLRSASDTIARLLVQTLLPQPWAELLDKLRSHTSVWAPGCKPERFEMFSSMGNGFTFELESVLFYALSSAACGHDGILVYGDDIVVPTCDYEKVTTALRNAGFEVNDTKSFHEGSFRESCGEDYFNGVRVTAPRIEHEISTVQDVVDFHNAVYDWFKCSCVIAPSQGARLLRRWRRSVEIAWKVPLGPSGAGNGHFWVNLDEATPSRHRCWDGWIYKTLHERFNDRFVPAAGSSGNGWFRDVFSDKLICSKAVLASALYENWRPLSRRPSPYERFKSTVPKDSDTIQGSRWNFPCDLPHDTVQCTSFTREWSEVIYEP